LYVILVLLGGVCILALARGWTPAVLAISWSLYLFYQVDPRRFGWPFPETAYFHPYAYQVLFVTLMALGFHRDWLVKAIDPVRERQLFTASALGFAALIVLFAIERLLLSVRAAHLMAHLFGRLFLRPGRLVATATVAPFLYLSTTYLWVPVRKHLGGLLLPLGRHSLYCYLMHMPFVALFERAAIFWSSLGRWSALLNGGAQLAVIGVLCVMVRFRILFRLFPD